jgi:hypothetical protein
MRRSVRWTLFVSVVTALAMFVAACGGDDNEGGGGGSKTATVQTKVQEGKKGGNLTYLAAGDVE